MASEWRKTSENGRPWQWTIPDLAGRRASPQIRGERPSKRNPFRSRFPLGSLWKCGFEGQRRTRGRGLSKEGGGIKQGRRDVSEAIACQNSRQCSSPPQLWTFVRRNEVRKGPL